MVIQTARGLLERLQQKKGLAELITPEDFCDEGAVASALARDKRLKSSQLRRVFGAVRTLERQVARENDETELNLHIRQRLALLRAELAYAKGRKLIPKDFYQVMTKCLQKDHLSTVADLRRLGEFLSAVVAYQKYHNPEA
ncbi:MAG: type III-A CRISPR-associated protein Csm2 [Anaerolineae bacterium]|nr:type III-A CRISPR-associated protein Csm2 [Anaerolineae bacterium]